MRKKILFGIDYTNNEFVKIILYLFVGGTAALVEWGLFYLFFYYLLVGLGLSIDTLTMVATALAFENPLLTRKIVPDYDNTTGNNFCKHGLPREQTYKNIHQNKIEHQAHNAY